MSCQAKRAQQEKNQQGKRSLAGNQHYADCPHCQDKHANWYRDFDDKGLLAWVCGHCSYIEKRVEEISDEH